MKRVLITGQNSYIGTSFKEWIEKKYATEISVEFITLRDEGWEKVSFSGYDAILHTAGIAHVPTKDNMKELYENINTLLPFKVAKKASDEGVKQFVFLSSMIVFGNGTGQRNLIDASTKPAPIDIYGESKLKAEKLLLELDDLNFKIAIVRPPMVYGPQSKGNFPTLLKFAEKVGVFPSYSNFRSMIFIDNLSECLTQIILTEFHGIVHPQNPSHVNTSELITLIRQECGRKTIKTGIANHLIHYGVKKNKTFGKVFGNFAYALPLSELPFKYQIVDTKTSIKLILEGNRD